MSKTLDSLVSSFAPSGKAAEETLQAIVLGEADALVIETVNGPRVYTLRDAAEPYRDLVERMSEAAVVLDVDHTILYCNGGLSRMLGRPNLAGQDLLSLVAPHQRGLAQGLLQAAALANSSAELLLIAADGAPTPARASGAPLSFDDRPCVALLVTALDDIESLKVSTAELRTSERRFQMALGNSPIVVFEQDLDLRYTWIFNPKLGYGGHQVIGKSDAEIMDPACIPRLTELKRGVIVSGRPARGEVATAAPGGPLQYYDMHIEPRLGADGKIIGIICAATDITERHRADQALRDSEQRLKLLAKASANVVFRMSPNWGEMRELLGGGLLADTTSPNRGWLMQYVPADEQERFNAAIDDAIGSRGPFELEHRVFRADGGIGWILSRAVPLLDRNGAIVEWIGSASDMTARKEDELTLCKNAALTRLAAEAARMTYAEFEFKSGRLNLAENFARVVGYTPSPGPTETSLAKIIGDLLARVAPQDQALVEAANREFLAGKLDGALTYRVIGDDGAERWIDGRWFAEKDASGALSRGVAACLDITDRRRNEQALRDSLKEIMDLKVALDEHAIVSFTDPDGVITYVNERFCAASKYAREDLIGQNHRIVNSGFHSRAFFKDLWTTVAGGRVWRGEVRNRAKDGSLYWVDTTIVPFLGADGEPRQYVSIRTDVTARKRAEDQLRETKQRIELANAASGVGVWEWNVKTNLICWDAQMFAIYGLQPTEDGLVHYEVWATSLPPEDRAGQEALLRSHIHDGGRYRREFRIRRHDNGELRDVQAIETIRVNVTGEVEWVIGTNLDVTESRRAEQAVRDSDERLRLALGNAKAAAWQWHIKTNALTWSRECYELYGRDPERDLARYELWRECLHPDDLEKTERLIASVLDRTTPKYRTEYRVILPNGEIRWLAALGQMTFEPDGTPLHLSGINLDITEQKRAEQQLAESETRFRLAQEASLDAFIIYAPAWDERGRVRDLKVVYVNPMAANFSRSTPDQMVGRMISEVLPGAKEAGGLIERFGRIIECGQTEELVLDYDADGVKRHFRNLIVPFGRYAAATFRDITAEVEGTRKLAAAKVEAERANQAKSRFLAAASHDLRQPVQSLVLLLSVIERQVAGQKQTIETARLMRAAVEGLHGLLNSVLDISRLDAGAVAPEFEIVDLGAIVGNLAEETRTKAESLGLELRYVPRSLNVRTDPALLGRVLRNLIENALRYTRKGGILLGVRRRGANARVDIIDTGIGIPRDKQAEIFEEFHQLNNPGRNLEQGLGLGLAIVSRLAELLGTRVEVSSRVDRGSRFSLSLPLDEEAAAIDAEEPVKVDDPGGRVLIVEDNAIVLYGLEAVLEDFGYQVSTAVSGEEALDVAEEADWRFDAIVTDHRLGEGRTGIETAREIHARAGRAIPTLVLTGDTDKQRIAEIKASGFAILHKPVDAEELRRHLAGIIGR